MAYTVPTNFQTRLSDDAPAVLDGTARAGTKLQLSRDDHTHAFGATQRHIDNETPTGVMTGTNGTDGLAAYTLSQSPNPAGSLMLVKTGVVMLQGTDYTLAAATITYVSPQIPISGNDWHRAWYRY